MAPAIDPFLPELHRKRIPLVKTWFQQDGATAHTAAASIGLLERHFKQRIISKNGPVNWPPRSPDLTAPDFFLWDYVKSQIYGTPTGTVKALKQRISECIRSIDAEVRRDSILVALRKRIEECGRRRGGHLDVIIFR